MPHTVELKHAAYRRTNTLELKHAAYRRTNTLELKHAIALEHRHVIALELDLTAAYTSSLRPHTLVA
jgi:hypothetical protein